MRKKNKVEESEFTNIDEIVNNEAENITEEDAVINDIIESVADEQPSETTEIVEEKTKIKSEKAKKAKVSTLSQFLY